MAITVFGILTVYIGLHVAEKDHVVVQSAKYTVHGGSYNMLLQVLLDIFSMHSSKLGLLFSASLLVVPLGPVRSLLHTFTFYDPSHAERAETTNPRQFLSFTWQFGKQSRQRDRPVL